MSHCDHCNSKLSGRRFYLDQNVEVYRYLNTGDCFSEIAAHTEAIVLFSDSIRHFCCAETGVPKFLHSLGLKILPPGVGPNEKSAKRNGPVEMTAPHIAYCLMEATKVIKLWLTHLEVHSDEYLCVVCPQCDGQLMEAEWQVAEENGVAALSEPLNG